MRIFILSLLIAITAVFNVNAASYASISSNAGIAGAKFMDLLGGVRNIALGQGYSAWLDDAASVSVNPAGLVLLNSNQIMFSHSFWLQNISYDYIAATFSPVKRRGKYGAALKLYKTDDIPHTVNSTTPDGYFRCGGTAAYLSFSDYISKKLAYGISSILIGEKLYDKSSFGAAVTAGVIYFPPREELLVPDYQKKLVPNRISLSLNNIGYKTKFVEQSDILPMKAKVGLFYKIIKNLDMGLGLDFPIDDKIKIGIGTEYNFRQLLFGRISYEQAIGGNDHGILGGVSGGFGVKYDKFSLDYALRFYSDLGLMNHLSFSFLW